MNNSNLLLLFITLLLEIVSVYSICPNWCNKNGICTSDDDNGYCVCNNGYYGDGCDKKYCPKAYDSDLLPLREARRTFRISTTLLSGIMNGRIILKLG